MIRYPGYAERDSVVYKDAPWTDRLSSQIIGVMDRNAEDHEEAAKHQITKDTR